MRYPCLPERSQADYLLTFEHINPLYSREASVGAQTLGTPYPSGTLPSILIRNLTAGSSTQQDIVVPDAARETHSKDGNEGAPATLPAGGEWGGRLVGYGHTGWFSMAVKGDRFFTIEAQALDEHGQPSENKARVVLGLWDAFNDSGSASVINSVQAMNSFTGGDFLSVVTAADGQLRLGVADERGDGRPDYVYRGRVLYADTVTPARLGAAGGTITIRGMGFRAGNQVMVAGVPAAVASLSPTEITARVAPPLPGSVGEVVVEVDDPVTGGIARIGGGLSFDAADGDDLNVVSAPEGVVSMNVPMPFVVRAMDQDMNPAPGVTVTFAVDFGGAVLGCGKPVCNVTAGGDGLAQMMVSSVAAAEASVSASLTNGASVRVEFTGASAPSIAALNPHLYLARGAVFAWQPRALVLSGGAAAAGQTVTWSADAGVAMLASASVTDKGGVASGQVLAGPLGQSVDANIRACVNGGTSCDIFTVSSVYPEFAGLLEVSGAGQTMQVADVPAPIVLQAVDAGGHPLAGAVVNLYQRLSSWTPPCAAQDRCSAAPVLATQAASAISDADGFVTIVPLSQDGVATRLSVTASTGLLAAVDFQIERHP